jgi:hypothetical protein
MAHAKLHMICGNCGANDMFEFEITDDLDDDTDEPTHNVYIFCKNCKTLHDLEDNAEKTKI